MQRSKRPEQVWNTHDRRKQSSEVCGKTRTPALAPRKLQRFHNAKQDIRSLQENQARTKRRILADRRDSIADRWRDHIRIRSQQAHSRHRNTRTTSRSAGFGQGIGAVILTTKQGTRRKTMNSTPYPLRVPGEILELSRLRAQEERIDQATALRQFFKSNKV